MKAHTNNFKEEIKTFGRQLDSIVTYTIGGVETQLGSEELNSVTPHFESDILKSVMKQLDIDSNVNIPIGTIINYKFGVLVNNEFEYLDYGNYIVYSVEKQEDTNSYKIVCYDKMLLMMKPYAQMPITYPITIRNYINAICTFNSLTFTNASDEFPNYDKEIQNELYLTSDNKDMGYTFRDVLDELAQATASTICINENDELEIRYINETVGKNLLNKSNYYKGTWRSNFVKVDEISTGLKLTTLQAGNQRWFPAYILDNSLLGKTITISAKITDANNKKCKFAIYWVNMNTLTYHTLLQTVEKSGNNEIMKLTITLPSEVPTTDTNIAVFLYAGVTGASIDEEYFYNELMIEENNVKTEYEPFGDTINEEFLKDINVNFGQKYGPVNSIVLSRAGGSDNVYLQDEDSIDKNGLCEIKISDNQIMNFNDRSDYLPDILEKLDGLEYYLNDYSSTGICYYDVCDRYNVKIDNNFYSCIMFNDEINITQGLEENIHTDMPQETETDYTKADKTDRRINQTYIIVDKQNQVIQSLAEKIVDVSATKSGSGSLMLENAYKGELHKLSIKGQISLLFPKSNNIISNPIVPYQNEILYPSSNLFLKSSILLIDDTEYKLDFNFLNYINNDVCDEFVYEDGKCQIIRRVGIDSQGNKYALDNEIIEHRKDIVLEVDKTSVIRLKSFDNVFYEATYLLENDYTDTFATNVRLNSTIEQTAEQISSKVSKNDLISEINQSAEQITITGNRFVVNSTNFKLTADGTMTCKNATLSGDFKTYVGNILATEINRQNMHFYDYLNSGIRVGSLSSVSRASSGVKGIELYTYLGGQVALGYADSVETANTIHNIMYFDTNNLNSTPWIINAASGTMFPHNSYGGVKVENGFITSWSLRGATGEIHLKGGDGYSDPTLVLEDGIIVNWYY